MEINHKFEFVEGNFETDTGKLVCVNNRTHANVSLCFKANMNIQFGEIKLFDSDLFVDAKATQDDAYALGNEITRRWNMIPELNKHLDASIELMKEKYSHHGWPAEDIVDTVVQHYKLIKKTIAEFKDD